MTAEQAVQILAQVAGRPMSPVEQVAAQEAVNLLVELVKPKPEADKP